MKARAAVRFASYGVPIAVTGDSDDLLDAALPFLPPLRQSFSEGRVARVFRLSSATLPDRTRVFSLHVTNGALAVSPHLRRVLDVLEWQVNLHIAKRARDRIFVHAGAVEWQGRAILVPGRSHSGKSTLVAALVRAGCGYLSDQYAILDSSGACHAFPRRVSLRVPGGIEKRTVEELGGRVHHEPLPVGLVLVTRYREGAIWAPVRISSGKAAMAMLENTVVARARAREALAVLGASTAHVDAFEGVRGDAAECVRTLLSSAWSDIARSEETASVSRG